MFCSNFRNSQATLMASPTFPSLSRRISRPWSKIGSSISCSRAAFGLPGMFIMRVFFNTCSGARKGCLRCDFQTLCLVSSVRPGVLRFITASVASGVMSLGEKPVPPVVKTRFTLSLSESSTNISFIWSHSSGMIHVWTNRSFSEYLPEPVC